MREKLSIASVALAVISLACSSPEPREPAPDPGVPRTLALERAAAISDLVYEVSLSVPERREDAITGRVVARFALSEVAAGRALFLDFAQPSDHLRALVVNGFDAETAVENEHVRLPAEALRVGENRVELEVVAGDGSLNRSDDFLYTLFVPDRARVALPVFDQPDLKARWRLELEIPAPWRALANGPLESEAEGGGRRTLRFAETRPLSTYQFAFAVGRFEVETGERAGRTFHMLHRESDSERVARNLDAIFDLHQAALEWLEEYTGIDYPFAKLDFALVPGFQYGGMEHPGAIFYRAGSLLLDPTATLNQQLGRASVISHETAHMWFGNLVTMEWFDDVWMKEVFANFMAAKIVHPSFPELDHDLRFLLAHYPAAYRVDRTAGANPIRQPLDNLAEAGSLYGAIIYQKAPIVMRQLERLIGEATFRQGLRAYLDQHRYGNATWTSLVETLDPMTDHDLAAWSRIWVEEAGRPVVRTRLAVEAGRVAAVGLEQEDPAGRGRVWIQPLRVRLGSPGGGTIGFDVDLDAPRVEVTPGLPLPDWVLANGAGEGYGRFEPDARTLAFLVASLPELPDPIARAVGWLTLWDAMLELHVSASELAETALRTVEVESDRLLVERVVADLGELFWRDLAPDQREAIAPRLERTLWSRLEAADEIAAKATFYRGYARVAITPAGIERLREIWRAEQAVAGFELSEQDLIGLAEELAVRDAEGSDALLDEQLERIEDPDRRRRFQFLLPALRSDAAGREEFARSLARPERREHEPWVLAGLSAVHHPLRAPQTEHLIRPALDLLEEVQRTGDIFFPLGWLEATLGGHRSQSAAAIVREFLADRPDLQDRLRGKLLQAADPLFRAAAMEASRSSGG